MSLKSSFSQPTTRRTRRIVRTRHSSAWQGPFISLLLILGLIACVGYAVSMPTVPLSFRVDRLPLGVALQGIYGFEQGPTGPYVWTKSQSRLILPVAYPGRYRLTLDLQSSPAAGARLVRVFANGQFLDAVLPDAMPRRYALEWELDPDAWRPGLDELKLDLETAPFFPPGDDRALGIILTHVALEPITPVIAPADALLCWLLLAVGVLVVGQLCAIPWRWRNAVLAVVVMLALILVAWDRSVALRLAAQPLLHPWLAVNGAAVVTIAALVVGPFARPPGGVRRMPLLPTLGNAAPMVLQPRIAPWRRAINLLVVTIPLAWALVVIVATTNAALDARDALAELLRFNPRRIESLQLAGVVFGYTLVATSTIRAVKPTLTIPILIAIFAVGWVALAAGSGALVTLLLLLALVIAWYELGRWALLLLGRLPRHRLERGVLAFAVGSGLFALWVLLIGSFGLLYPPAVAIPVAALVASLVSRWALALRSAGHTPHRLSIADLLPGGLRRVPSWFETAMLGQVVGFMLIGGAVGLGPEIMTDAFRVHLVIAQQFAFEHRVFAFSELGVTFSPIHGQLLYTAGMSIGGPSLAKLIHTATGYVVIAGVGVVSARLSRSETAGLIAAGLFASLPLALLELGIGYTDLFETLYCVVALLCVLRFLASRDWRWALLLGLALGFGVAAKLRSGVLAIGASLALAVGFVRCLPLRLLPRALVAFAIGLAVTGGVWVLRTIWLTQAIPGLAILSGALGLRTGGRQTGPVTNLAGFGTGRNLASLWRLPWDLSFATARFGENADGFVGFALLLLLPCLLALPRRRRVLAALVFVAVPLVLWFYTAQYLRYLLSTLALLAVVLGAATVFLWRRLARFGTAGVLARRAHASGLTVIMIGSLLFYFATFFPYPGSLPVRVVLGREPPESYLAQTLGIYEATRQLDRLVAPGTAVAALPDGPGLYTHARLITPFTVESGLIHAGSIAQLRALLDRYGITYLLIEHAAIQPHWGVFWIMRPEFLREQTDRVFTAGGATIYRLRPTGSEEVGGPELLRDPGLDAGIGRGGPWLPIGNAPIPAATGPAPRGGESIAVDGRAGYYQVVPVQGGQGYRLRFAARSDQPGALAELRIDWFNSAGLPVESSSVAVSVTSEWADYSLWRPAPAEATTAVVYILARNATTCWFDDYSFMPAD